MTCRITPRTGRKPNHDIGVQVGAEGPVIVNESEPMTPNAASSIVNDRKVHSNLEGPRGRYRSSSSLKESRMYSSLPHRSYEIVAQRPDGSLFIGQDNAPAIPLFEKPFSAFAHGTMVLTSQGDIPVEDLQPGDMIIRADGKPVPLIWIGSSSFVPADTGSRTPLIRFMADSLGEGRPSGFLTFGPNARILHTPSDMRGNADLKKLLTPVRELVDGVNIIEIAPPTPVRLYHICLARHAAVKVGGLDIETFHPGPYATRDLPIHMRDRFLGMFPHIHTEQDFGPLAYPRTPEAASELV